MRQPSASLLGLFITGVLLQGGCAGPNAQEVRSSPSLAYPRGGDGHNEAEGEAAASRAAAAQSPKKAPTFATELLGLDLTLPTFEHEARCGEPVCQLPLVVPNREFYKTRFSSEAPNVALWVQRIEENSTLRFPSNSSVELYALVLSGSLVASTEQAETANLSPGSALRLEYAGLSLGAVTRSSLVVGVVSKSMPLPSAVAESNRLRAQPIRSGRLELAELDAQKALCWGADQYAAKLLFGQAAGRPGAASLALLVASPAGAIATNVHESEWEHLAILSGSGTLQLGARREPVGPGQVIQIAPGVDHGYEPDGTSPLRAVQLFAPSGPEARYLELSQQAGCTP
jgi:mannose-6-phosphate isomerase-like protein (cupin superfamily)